MVVGGALPGLVAAARLAMRGAQVLIIEEDCAVTSFPGLKEPFLMTGASSDSVLGACLTAIGVPLIDRRNLQSEPLAYQIVWPGTRLNFGDIERTAQEFDCWDVADCEVTRNLLSALDQASAAEGARLLASQLASTTRRADRAPRPVSQSPNSSVTLTPNHVETAIASAPMLAGLLDAQSRALADFGSSPPPQAARNRLVGSALHGAVRVSGKDPWLTSLLRQRIEARHGEFRRMSSAFRIVQSGNLPALVAEESHEVCAARALIINAPTSSLVEMGCHTNDEKTAAIADSADSWLPYSPPAGRRLTLHLRGDRKLLPSGIASRLICVGDLSAPMDGTNVVRVRFFDRDGKVDLLADASVPFDASEDERAFEDIGRRVVSLMPLGDEGWTRVAIPTPVWDRSDLLTDAAEKHSGPIPGLHRPLSRVPAYILDRTQNARLGFEGDLMLGWQAGDAIGSELR